MRLLRDYTPTRKGLRCTLETHETDGILGETRWFKIGNNKVTIKFEVENEFGNVYKQSSFVELFPDLGNTFCDELGRKLNTFMSQMGYPSFNKDLVLIESVTEDEADAILSLLNDMRNDG